MPGDSYHGSDKRDLGLRIHQMQPGVRIAVRCIRCNRFATATHENTLRHFRHDTPVSLLPDLLAVFCRAKKEGGECRREIVSPDDGCSDAG